MLNRRLIAIALFATPILAPALVAIAGATAQNAPPATGKSASIPFVHLGSIQNFQPDGQRGVYLQGNGRAWYYATVWPGCTGLPFAEHIGVKTGAPDTLDHFGSIIVDGRECQIDTLVTSAGPPKQAKKSAKPAQ